MQIYKKNNKKSKKRKKNPNMEKKCVTGSE